jgi:hypothetical protein
MEDVLEVYQRPRDADVPVVCLDESSKQLISETRVPIAVSQDTPLDMIMSTSATEPPTCS